MLFVSITQWLLSRVSYKTRRDINPSMLSQYSLASSGLQYFSYSLKTLGEFDNSFTNWKFKYQICEDRDIIYRLWIKCFWNIFLPLKSDEGSLILNYIWSRVLLLLGILFTV